MLEKLRRRRSIISTFTNMAASTSNKEEETENYRVIYTYPLIKQSDMPENMKVEVTELCQNACEKHTDNFNRNNDKIARLIKETMDRKYGRTWHVVVGEGFSFEVIYELQTLMYLFSAGNIAICLWKCA